MAMQSVPEIRAATPADTPVEPSIWNHFASFTVFHAVTVLGCALLALGALRMGLIWRGTERERRMRHIWGWSIVGVKTIETIYWSWPGIFVASESIPIQLCDLAALAAAIAMLTQWRLSRTLLYFWGIGLSTQAFATPTVEFGLAHPRYWFFWVTHLMIVGSAVYDIVVLGYRPKARDLLAALACTLGYAAFVTAINLPTGWNYGYIGNTRPERPTIIDRLGPWPDRVLIIGGIVTAMFSAMWLIWCVPQASPRRAEPEPAANR